MQMRNRVHDSDNSFSYNKAFTLFDLYILNGSLDIVYDIEIIRTSYENQYNIK